MGENQVETRRSEAIRQHELSRENGWAFLSAVQLGDLIEAREHGLFREIQIDLDEAAAYVGSQVSMVKRQWDNSFEQLLRIVSYGGPMEYEELMTVLTLRSNLESSCRFVGADRRQKLRDELDPPFQGTLEANRGEVMKLRQLGTADLSCLIPGHWWWRKVAST
ncbi:MAG: hypothetical protein AAGF23_19590 [Acidobacteriota bacterium]